MIFQQWLLAVLLRAKIHLCARAHVKLSTAISKANVRNLQRRPYFLEWQSSFIILLRDSRGNCLCVSVIGRLTHGL